MEQDLLKELVDNIYPIKDHNERLIAYKEWVWRAAASMSPPIGAINHTLEVKRELERDFPLNDTRKENDTVFVEKITNIVRQLGGGLSLLESIELWRKGVTSDEDVMSLLDKEFDIIAMEQIVKQ